MGVCCSKFDKAADEADADPPLEAVEGAITVTAPPLVRRILEEAGLPQSDWERLGGSELEQPLRDELVKCVDSRFLVDLLHSGGRIERMQDLPDHAFISLEDLKNLGVYETDVYESGYTTYERLPIIILSYAWLGRAHPDPHAETLDVLVKALEQMPPHGVIIDFTSLPQVPRTDEENERFNKGLKMFNSFYSHPHTLVFQVTEFPAGYPSARSYDLPEGLTPAVYQERGWCFAEACMSSLGKTPKFLCNLSLMRGDEEDLVYECMNEFTPPPLFPSAFNEQLSTKVFTQKKTDLALVQKLYEDAFQSRIHDATNLMFADLMWGEVEVFSFAQVITVNQHMRHLDLSKNNVGEEGTKALWKVIGPHPTLSTLQLRNCWITAAGAIAMEEGLKVNRVLTTLELDGNEIGDEGARCIAEGLKVSTLTSLDISWNEIGDEGARFIAESLKINSALTKLNIAINSIRDEGARCIAEGLEVNSALTTLELHNNEIGDEGARCIAEGLKVNSALTSLSLGGNVIRDQGACCIVEGLKVNSALTDLELDRNEIGVEGESCIAEAARARPGCSILR